MASVSFKMCRKVIIILIAHVRMAVCLRYWYPPTVFIDTVRYLNKEEKGIRGSGFEVLTMMWHKT
jgi:hypothetical protein